MINFVFFLTIFIIFVLYIIIIHWDKISQKILSTFFSKKPRKGKYHYVCPRCGSKRLKNIFLISPVELGRPGARRLNELKSKYTNKLFIGSTVVFGSFLPFWQPRNPQVYICFDCDYNGICPEIREDKIKEFRKKLKENMLNKK